MNQTDPLDKIHQSVDILLDAINSPIASRSSLHRALDTEINAEIAKAVREEKAEAYKDVIAWAKLGTMTKEQIIKMAYDRLATLKGGEHE